MVTFFKNDGTVAAAKQMLNSSDDDIKTSKERLSMIEEKTPLLQCNGGVFLLLPNQKECKKNSQIITICEIQPPLCIK